MQNQLFQYRNNSLHRRFVLTFDARINLLEIQYQKYEN